MNGQNSSTSGTAVAGIGYWPKNILGKLVTLLGGAIVSLKGLLTGELLPAQVDFANKSGSDCIDDAVMEELARRFIITFEKANQEGNVIFAKEAPEDKTKVWWQTDPVTDIPIGQPKTWDANQSLWVPIVQNPTTYNPPLRRNGLMASPAGASTQNFTFADILTEDYRVVLTPTTFNNGSWAPPPATFPAAFGFVLSNKTNTTCSVSFVGVPTGGLVWEIDIESRLPNV